MIKLFEGMHALLYLALDEYLMRVHATNTIIVINSVTANTCDKMKECLKFRITDCVDGDRQVCMYWEESEECVKDSEGGNEGFSHVCDANPDQDGDKPNKVGPFKPCDEVCTTVDGGSGIVKFGTKDGAPGNNGKIHSLLPSNYSQLMV